MDYQRIEHTLRERYEQTGDVRALKVTRRISRLLSKRGRRARKATMSRSANSPSSLKSNAAFAQITHLADAMSAGKTIVAFDAEWPYHGDPRLVHEVGLAIWRPSGITIQNIILKRHGKVLRKDRFPGGSTVMTDDEIAAYLAELWGETAILLGHNLSEDFRQMKRIGADIGHKHYFDTVKWSKLAFPDAPAHRLSAMAQSCVVPARRAHIAGNDAAMVMDCAIVIIERMREAYDRMSTSTKPSLNA